MTDAEAIAALGAAPDASEAELKSAYRQRLRLTHPDCGGSTIHLMRVTEAWRTLQASAETRRRCLICSGSGRQTWQSGFTRLVTICTQCGGSGKKP
jgi:DnaJ-class molecular chaperone